MDSQSSAVFDARVRALSEAVSGLFPIPRGHIIEAVASGFEARTYAALRAREFPKPLSHENFDPHACLSRLVSFTDESLSNALGVLLEEARLKIVVKRRPVQPPRYAAVAYDVRASLSGANLRAGWQDAVFEVPERITAGGREPFRIDSAHQHRPRLTSPVRGRDDRLLSAKLNDAKWDGGLYIYDERDQQDDRRCVAWVNANLARVILTAAAPDVRCHVFRPYAYRDALRVRVAISERIRETVSGSTQLFSLPRLKFHRTESDKFCWADQGAGRLVDGLWTGDVYPNGAEGLRNPLSATSIRAAFLSAATEAVAGAGAVGDPVTAEHET